MKARVASSLAFCIALAACAPATSTVPMQSIALQSPAGERVEVRVEIADDPAEQSEGLMFREALAPGTGMLFVFTEETPLSFWMKNTRVPLDIIFFDHAGRFLSSASMDPCAADPCPSYPSDAPALYALEVPRGFVAEYDIGPGWALSMEN